MLFRTDTGRLQTNNRTYGSSKGESRKLSTKHRDSEPFHRVDGESVTAIASSYTPQQSTEESRYTDPNPDAQIYKTTGWTVVEERRKW